LARAPIPLLRHGFGRLLGPRFLLLEHLGRHSGLPRYVALEVVDPTESRLIEHFTGQVPMVRLSARRQAV
jgi:hypothetical protein